MELTAQLVKVGTYHEPSVFTADNGRRYDVPAYWDGIAQFDDGDFAQLRMQGLSPTAILKVGQKVSIQATNIAKRAGMWAIKGNVTPIK